MASPLDFNDRMLSLGLARVSEAAAHAAVALIGRGDEKAADLAAIEAMRRQLNLLDVDGTVQIGAGERDEAPMLYVGEKVGNGTGPTVDIALDALEGRTLTAKDLPNAMTVIAMAPSGTLASLPKVYMDKLAIGPGYPENVVTLSMRPGARIEALASARGVRPSDITCCVLDRPRHSELVQELRDSGAALRLIGEADVAGMIYAGDPELTGVDVYMGIGTATDGVLAAAALKCMGGQFWGRLAPRNADDAALMRRAGITHPDRIYARDDLVQSDVIFAATGVTRGSLLRGVRRSPTFIESETILMRSKTGSMRRMIYRNPIR